MRANTLALLLALPLSGIASAAAGQAADGSAYAYPYSVEKIATPEGLTAEVGGLTFLPDGRLVAVFHHGEVMIYRPDTKEWRVFATGLHDPLGVVAVSDHEFIIAQRPEITRVVDTDGDGKADVFQTITDQFGMSGNYAEFTHGPVMDAEGGLYFSLNTASNNGPVRDIIRGVYSPQGHIGRMFSAVPYRGWVMKVTPDGKTIPWASGFRSPNGLALDKDGNLWVTDNQGDWLGSSKLFLVHRGRFHGHVPSLAWEKGFHTIPLTLPVPILNEMRVPQSVFFPYGVLANSPSQPIFDYTDGKFGPFENQMFVGEMNHHLLMRVMLEEVNHQMQGAVVPFITGDSLRLGSNRLAFAPDGSLWVGHTDHGWLGDEGISRIVWDGRMPLDIAAMHLDTHGFELVFTKPLDGTVADDPSSYHFSHFRYQYSIEYGSPRLDEESVPVKGVRVSSDRKHVWVTLGEILPGYVYQLDAPDLEAGDGTPLVNSTAYYTVDQLRKPGPAGPPTLEDATMRTVGR